MHAHKQGKYESAVQIGRRLVGMERAESREKGHISNNATFAVLISACCSPLRAQTEKGGLRPSNKTMTDL